MNEIQALVVKILDADPHAKDCDVNREIPFPCDCDVPALMAQVAESVGIPVERTEWGGWRVVPRWRADHGGD